MLESLNRDVMHAKIRGIKGKKSKRKRDILRQAEVTCQSQKDLQRMDLDPCQKVSRYLENV